MAEPGEPAIHFVTFGMFIIDQIHFPASGRTVDDIIGGAGTFGIVGARLFSPPPTLSKTLGWIVDAGNDFPDDIRTELQRWDTKLVLRENSHRQTTRGRCNEIVDSISSLRTSSQSPILIWEPVPDLCTPSELSACLETLQRISVVSPNAAELGAFYGLPTVDAEVKSNIEENAEKWYNSGIGPSKDGPVVVRAGKDGCYIRHKDGKTWLPAYFNETSAEKVVDPTGGGNCFIGGLAVGLVRTSDVVLSAAWATVAASFAIEQIGMPVLTHKDGLELWNGVDPQQRLSEYLKRAQLT